MVNEIEEFEIYTGEVDYTANGKKDSAWLHRLTPDMLLTGEGFARVLTIIARGYMWNSDIADIEKARRALCAWCSVPETKKRKKTDEWQRKICYPELHDEFPVLVDKDGNGWIVRHVRGICAFAREHPQLIQKNRLDKIRELEEEFDSIWSDRVRHYLVPIFSPSTTATWGTCFDSVIADALELGKLRKNDILLTDEQEAWVINHSPDGVPAEVLRTLVLYYVANKQPDSDWVVLPVTNFGADFGTTSFGRKWLPALCKEAISRDVSGFGVSRYMINGLCL